MKRLSKPVRNHLEKSRNSVIAAVENYNRPGRYFRTRTFVVLMVIGWTALFHAIFYQGKIKPWYVRSGKGRGKRYLKVDGEPKYWELSECIKRYYGSENPPERKNLEFMLRLRNKIEHREHPELDPALYGECQSMLMNYEELLAGKFGTDHALKDELTLALQFSVFRPERQEEAIKRLQTSAAQDILDFIELFRAELPGDVLQNSRYAMKVFLIPKIANRQSSADLAVEFVPYNSADPDELKSLEKVTALIKEKRIPIASHGLMRPQEIVDRLNECLPYEVSMHVHTQAWKHYQVRPGTSADEPEKTKSQYCVYDALLRGYGYTDAWVKFLCKKLKDPMEFRKVVGKEPQHSDSPMTT